MAAVFDYMTDLYRFLIEVFPSLNPAGCSTVLSLFMGTQLGPGESALSCCSGLQHNKHTAFTQSNDGVMMYHCSALRWTTVTDSWRSAQIIGCEAWRDKTLSTEI